jgi:hypothetical protein
LRLNVTQKGATAGIDPNSTPAVILELKAILTQPVLVILVGERLDALESRLIADEGHSLVLCGLL